MDLLTWNARTKRATLYALVLAAIALRVAAWTQTLPLRMDEAKIALNVMHRSPVDLLGALEFDQAAPWGFLLGLEGAVALLGPTEHALRLVPLVASVAAVCLFARFTWERYALSVESLMAVAFFAFLPTLILEAADLKQYSVDVAITSGLLLLWHRRGLGWPTLIAGLLAPWFSFPSVFVLAGLGLTELRSRPVHALRAGGAWLFSFGAYWAVSLRQTASNPFLTTFWEQGFVPPPPDLFLWLARQFVHFFHQPATFVAPGLAAGLAGMGFLRLSRHDTSTALVTAVTVFTALTASSLHLYPFFDRTLYYLVPFGVLGLGFSVGYASNVTGYRRALFLGLVGSLLMSSLVPVLYGAFFLRNVSIRTDLRDYRALVQRLERKAERPSVYVHDMTLPGFVYYAERFNLNARVTEVPPSASISIEQDSAWIVVGSPWDSRPSEVRDRFERWRRSYTACDSLRAPGIRAYRVCSSRPERDSGFEGDPAPAR